MESDSVRVCIRVRPQLPREYKQATCVQVLPPNRVRCENRGVSMESNFDRVFGPDSRQEDIFEEVSPSVDRALEGYNCTVFAYGQTGTGKTYTISGADYERGHDYRYLASAAEKGPGSSDDVGPESSGATEGGEDELASTAGPNEGGDHNSPGLVPRVALSLFQRASALSRGGRRSVAVFASYLEIYNERLHDLLEPYRPDATRFLADRERKAGLAIRDLPSTGPYVPGLTVARVRDAAGLLSLVRRGNRHREVHHTQMNQHSSRSHTLLQLSIEQRWDEGGDAEVVRSKINLVDLAGSERWGDGGMPDEQVAEMASINQSLGALASVVAALTTSAPFVPYRDSKLTHLLSDSLGGNCLTTLIATVSPAEGAFQETLSTLRFADRARAIVNRAQVNAEPDLAGQVAARDAEIARLRGLLAVATGEGGAREAVVMGDRLRQAETRIATLQGDVAGLREVLASERAQRRQLEAMLADREREVLVLQDQVIKMRGKAQCAELLRQEDSRDMGNSNAIEHDRAAGPMDRAMRTETFALPQLSSRPPGDASPSRSHGRHPWDPSTATATHTGAQSTGPSLAASEAQARAAAQGQSQGQQQGQGQGQWQSQGMPPGWAPHGGPQQGGPRGPGPYGAPQYPQGQHQPQQYPPGQHSGAYMQGPQMQGPQMQGPGPYPPGGPRAPQPGMQGLPQQQQQWASHPNAAAVPPVPRDAWAGSPSRPPQPQTHGFVATSASQSAPPPAVAVRAHPAAPAALGGPAPVVTSEAHAVGAGGTAQGWGAPVGGRSTLGLAGAGAGTARGVPSMDAEAVASPAPTTGPTSLPTAFGRSSIVGTASSTPRYNLNALIQARLGDGAEGRSDVADALLRSAKPAAPTPLRPTAPLPALATHPRTAGGSGVAAPPGSALDLAYKMGFGGLGNSHAASHGPSSAPGRAAITAGAGVGAGGGASFGRSSLGAAASPVRGAKAGKRSQGGGVAAGASFGAGSWAYILGPRASSVVAQQMARRGAGLNA